MAKRYTDAQRAAYWRRRYVACNKAYNALKKRISGFL